MCVVQLLILTLPKKSISMPVPDSSLPNLGLHEIVFSSELQLLNTECLQKEEAVDMVEVGEGQED